MCTRVCTFLLQNGTLWDIWLMHCGIYEMVLLRRYTAYVHTDSPLSSRWLQMSWHHISTWPSAVTMLNRLRLYFCMNSLVHPRYTHTFHFSTATIVVHGDVIKWKHFTRYWSFVRGTIGHWWTPPRKGQWRGALVFSLICARTNCQASNRDAGHLGRYRTYYDFTVLYA